MVSVYFIWKIMQNDLYQLCVLIIPNYFIIVNICHKKTLYSVNIYLIHSEYIQNENSLRFFQGRLVVRIEKSLMKRSLSALNLA